MSVQRFGPFTQTPVATWAASQSLRTNLDRLGLVTRIVFTAEITPSAALAAGTSSPGGLYRVMLNHRILAGNKVFMEIPNTGESGNGGQIIHAMNALDFHGMPGFPDSQGITGPDRTYVPVSFVFHCGSRPQDKFGRDNPFDLSAFIPAKSVTDLIGEWTTGVAAGLDDTITINSGTGRYTLYYVIGSHAEVMQEMARQEVRLPSHLAAQGATGMVPSWVANTFALDAAYTEYSLTRNLQTGRYLKRVFIGSQDATGNNLALMASDEVTGAKIKIRNNDVVQVFQDAAAALMPKGNFLVADDAVELGAGGHTKGIIPIDLRSSGHPDYGYDLTRGESGQVGAAQLAQTVTTNGAGDDALYLEEAYEPYFDSLGG